ncbi:unnamed protein product [Didymodactylos carnosus]|uniref:Poly [ADP-ribose] polymerase n=1 Tax=Didymodactylos carnosus TaxID=1234261 RepID=A0A8S2FJZ1_9BILA|nr:unnamed protein product [Didymodactylos carnosus]CAF4282359.1 unnamed protein product [Didymodactylos carnosus]
MRKKCPEMEEKISHITDSKRTKIDLWNGLQGSKCSRETRMECVAWIAVCKFDCRLEGGFIRDWVVGNYVGRPSDSSLPPSKWIDYQKGLPFINKEVIPSDLDFHLPIHVYFDIEKFLDELHRYQIDFKVFREDWRYVFLFDENAKTGPFTMDLIEPHIALTHDLIDFDVSNLSLEKDYTKELGMRVDITLPPYSFDLESTVDNIKNKRFQVLRPIDEENMKERIAKMETRGWKQTGEPVFVIPNPSSKYNFLIVALPKSIPLYKALSQDMQKIGSTIKIISIEQIKNPHLEETYESMKQLMAKQCENENPNERELYHGTRDDGINGILEYGYDDRFYHRDGAWGHGSYFADTPIKSHEYTAKSSKDHTRTIYYNKVLLGKQFKMDEIDQHLAAAPKDYHSIHGTVFKFDEYVVYRYGQALPYIKITYTSD